MTPSREVAERPSLTPAQQLAATVRSADFQSQVALALPEGTPPARFVRIAATALLENPDIAEAVPDSVFSALLKAAADGLLPDGREAALTVFKDTKTNTKRAAYMPMVGGFRKIAAEHGWTLEAHAVWADDNFAYVLGSTPAVTHEPAPLGTKREKLVAAYAIATERATGHKMLEVMTAQEVEKVRSKAKRKEIWNEWPERMYEKTVARRLFKSLPLGDRERVKRVLDAESLTPAAAEALVYGQTPRDDTEQTAPPTQAASGAVVEEEQPEPAGAPPPPFKGEAPSAPAEPVAEAEPEAAAFDYTFGDGWEDTRYHGQTFADIVAAEDREWLEWLASDAVEDEGLRDAAAQALDALGPAA